MQPKLALQVPPALPLPAVIEVTGNFRTFSHLVDKVWANASTAGSVMHLYHFWQVCPLQRYVGRLPDGLQHTPEQLGSLLYSCVTLAHD